MPVKTHDYITVTINRNKALLLFFIWLGIQFSILFLTGINTEGESKRFIDEAARLINHQSFSTSIYFMYLIEIILVFLKIKFSLSFWSIIFIQLTLNSFSLLRFYQFIKKSFNSENLAFWGSFFLTICIPYQLYNSYIYTESIFFSLSILYSCFLLSVDKFRTKELIQIVGFLFILCITRPSGIFFVMATFVYVFFKNTKNTPAYLKIASLIIIPSIILFILNIMMKSGKGVDVLLPFKQEHIICDVPTRTDSYTNDSESSSTLFNLIKYIFSEPMQFIKLGFLKTVAFFGLIRPYYSNIHNIYLGAYFYSLYAVVLFGLIKRKMKINSDNLFYFALFVIFWISVVFSCDEWHSRFFLTLTPCLILMSIRSIHEFNRHKIAA